MEKNPELIQDLDLSRDGTKFRPRVPLILIHDGGGTTYAYYCLDPIGRPLYGIFNPHYHSGASFEGGVRGMARLYAGMIRQTCAEPDFLGQRNSDGSVNILIGGWSMGGLISVEIAKMLTGDQNVRVIGVLMIDSICPVHLVSIEGDLDTSLDHLEVGKSNENFARSIRAMKEALRVIRRWDPPVWDQVEERPRFSLLRAIDSLVIPGGKRVHVIDYDRHDRTLGWDRYDPDLFTETLDVEGSHFDMFSFKLIPGISKAIKRCCDTLEKLGQV
jgi:thioesterase domain-containing protein